MAFGGAFCSGNENVVPSGRTPAAREIATLPIASEVSSSCKL